MSLILVIAFLENVNKRLETPQMTPHKKKREIRYVRFFESWSNSAVITTFLITSLFNQQHHHFVIFNMEKRVMCGRTRKRLANIFFVLKRPTALNAFFLAFCRFLHHEGQNSMTADFKWPTRKIFIDRHSSIRREISLWCLFEMDLPKKEEKNKEIPCHET